MNRPIIVFDSGIGGLSIYRPLKIALPNHNIVYISDPQGFPYGDKKNTWLESRFGQLAVQFELLHPQLLILACNTATTNIITQLRARMSCSIVGVEPVIKPLASYQSALALMTTSSASSKSTLALLKKYGTHVKVFTPVGLASAIEYNDYEQVKKYIHEIKKIVQKNKIEAIGLSCTHYPLILTEFQKAMPAVKFIDPSAAVVKEVLRVVGLKHV